MRRQVVWLITFAGGLYFLLEFLLPANAPAWLGGFGNPFTACRGAVSNFLIVVGTMAFLLGPINLARTHLTALLRRHKTWLESAVFLAFLVAGLLAAGLKGPSGKDVLARLYNALFFGLMMAFGATSMGILTFYLVSAAYRSFRVNSLDSCLMMVSAAIVLLGQVPLGDWLTQGPPDALQLRSWAQLIKVSLGDWLTQAVPDAFQLRSWTQWIIMVPNTAVHRAVLLGTCAGAFAAGLRQWLGIGSRG